MRTHTSESLRPQSPAPRRPARNPPSPAAAAYAGAGRQRAAIEWIFPARSPSRPWLQRTGLALWRWRRAPAPQLPLTGPPPLPNARAGHDGSARYSEVGGGPVCRGRSRLGWQLAAQVGGAGAWQSGSSTAWSGPAQAGAQAGAGWRLGRACACGRPTCTQQPGVALPLHAALKQTYQAVGISGKTAA